MSAHDILKSLGLSADNSGTYLGHGEWAGTQDAGVLEPINPSTGEVISRVPLASKAEVRTAIENSLAAQPAWARRGIARRLEAVARFRERIVARHETLARTRRSDPPVR